MPESYAALSDDDLIRLLSTEEDRLPHAAVDEILRRGARLAPTLLRILDDPASWEQGGAPVHAAFILARLQPPGLLEPLLRAVRAAIELGEFSVVDVADPLLAACGPSALPPLIAAAHGADETLELRLCATEAVARIALAHPGAREAGKDHLKSVAQDENEEEELRMTAAAALLEFAAPPDEPFLRALTQDDFLRPEDIREALAGRHPPFYAKPIDWLDFYREREDGEDLDEPEVDLPDDPALDVLSRIDEGDGPPAPIVNASPKVGRNDPCPCGSGKKSKKCCGA